MQASEETLKLRQTGRHNVCRARGNRTAMATNLRLETTVALKPLIARAGAVINGEAYVSRVPEPRAVIDGLMKR
jgi:hypothetical protein